MLTCAIKVTLEIFGTVFIQSILESDHKSYHIILNSENYIFVDPERKEKYISPTRLLLFIENDDLLFQLLYSLTIKDWKIIYVKKKYYMKKLFLFKLFIYLFSLFQTSKEKFQHFLSIPIYPNNISCFVLFFLNFHHFYLFSSSLFYSLKQK